MIEYPGNWPSKSQKDAKYYVVHDRRRWAVRRAAGMRIKRRTVLSDHVGQAAASSRSRRLMGSKGYGGGGIYINEERHFFAPVADRDYEYVYLGTLLDDPWFNEPVR